MTNPYYSDYQRNLLLNYGEGTCKVELKEKHKDVHIFTSDHQDVYIITSGHQDVYVITPAGKFGMIS
ncbi:hypothetical protein CHS0354_029058 [Potamilus streckersoni]|uniref:Uncharacterized protein n=1 Tax=Potamilus streckersoni TaxID=2493646 RepID=A0AAE0W0R7_9BIVA|nr:hypothetical protein CHS0354_029058 [Potamilus streckersoni]